MQAPLIEDVWKARPEWALGELVSLKRIIAELQEN